jgi:hypothetical protein
VQLFHLGEDLAEQHNRADSEPARVQSLTALLEQLVANGRSTPGPKQSNSVDVQLKGAVAPK